MNKTLLWILLGAMALILLVVFSPFAFISHIVYRTFSKKYDLWYYFNALAVGIDDLGASFLYGSKNHTISAITGSKASQHNLWHIKQAKVIDYFFGKDHCKNEAINEGIFYK